MAGCERFWELGLDSYRDCRVLEQADLDNDYRSLIESVNLKLDKLKHQVKCPNYPTSYPQNMRIKNVGR